MKLKSIDEILDFAIAREEEAAALYASLAETIDRPGMRQTFLEFAAEEERHKLRLMRIKEEKLIAGAADEVASLGIAEILVAPEPGPNMTYAEALRFAMAAEKRAFQLYSELAAAAPEQTLAQAFSSLAMEEARHKLRFEVEYDEHVLEGV